MEKSGRLGSDSNETTGNGGVATADSALVQPTYKQLPDEDVNWQKKNSANVDKKETSANMGKPNGTDTEPDDGAQERMLKDDLKTTVIPSKDASEVKFISENGDAKIDIETVKQSLSGMGKAELMKYANDPFWIKLRWFLFIAFWLLWAAMLAGAIAIVVMAPKCTPPGPKQYWEESVIVRIDPSEGITKDLSGLEPFLDDLEKQHVKALSLSSILQESAPGHTKDYKDISQKVGLIEDFKIFVDKAGKKKINVILELDPNHSSDQHPWFQKSIKKEEPYTSYYVWSVGRKSPESSTLLPPNNWQSINGGSAWTFNDERKEFYLHQFNETQPDFNFTNPAVINEFSDIFKHWIGLGIKGFRLSNTRYLVENPKLTNDAVQNIAETDTYQSLHHTETRDYHLNADVLKRWRDVIKNHTDGTGLFAMTDEISPDVPSIVHKNTTVIDLPQNIHFLENIEPTVKATALNESISKVMKFVTWPGIDLNGKKNNLRKRMHTEVADSLILMTMLLPATPILKINDTTSAKDAFAALAEERTKLQFLYGDLQTYVMNNETVFIYTRSKSGNPGYLVAYNSAPYNTTINVTKLPHMPEEVTHITHSPNYIKNLDKNAKLMSNDIQLSPKSTLVVSFVPKS